MLVVNRAVPSKRLEGTGDIEDWDEIGLCDEVGELSAEESLNLLVPSLLRLITPVLMFRLSGDVDASEVLAKVSLRSPRECFIF